MASIRPNLGQRATAGPFDERGGALEAEDPGCLHVASVASTSTRGALIETLSVPNASWAGGAVR